MIGILGGGQLGRMLALAGHPLGLRFRFLDPSPDAPARELGELVRGAYDDPEPLARFAQGLDLVTYEFENVPVDAARRLAAELPLYPPPAALEVAQERLVEKEFFQRLAIPTPPFAPVESRAELEEAVARIGLPAILKTRRFGYDGKGQAMLRTPEEIDSAWAALGGQPLILEKFIPFNRELSILAVRGREGEQRFYPLVENVHRAGILHLSRAPAEVSPALQAKAEGYAARVLEALNYVGLLAIEMFEVNDSLMANEMAPRVHNSGHWSIEGAACSQFENHLRAILALPLGATTPVGYSAMINLIGELPDIPALLAIPGGKLHLYDKAPRPGRKLGHFTLQADDRQGLEQQISRVERLLHG